MHEILALVTIQISIKKKHINVGLKYEFICLYKLN